MSGFRHCVVLVSLLSFSAYGQPLTKSMPDDPRDRRVESRLEAAPAAAPRILDRVSERIPGTSVSFDFTYIPGGTFMMGSDEGEPGREEDEGPRRLVAVEPFWMMVHELTHDAYNVFMYKEQDSDSTLAPGYDYSVDAAVRPSPPYEDPAFGMPKSGHPAVGMTQWGALQFARWLYEKTGTFYRLPTEAEWEYACRAGSDDAYTFGDDATDLDEYAWYWDNSGETYQAVGSKTPNKWGLYDMHGNVAEWTLDEYQRSFYGSIEEGAVGPWSMPTKLHPRTVRGGAYDDDPPALRCAARLESSMAWKRRDPQLPKSFWWNTDSPFVGFRLVRPAVEPSPDEIAEFFAITLGE